jgi:hypothetical protein
MVRLFFVLLAASSVPVRVWAQPPVTPANWRSHPAIRDVRSISREIDAAIRQGSFSVQTRSAECGGGELSLTAKLYTDSSRRVRKYVIKGGDGDSAGEVRYYYDDHGGLRFTFEVLRAVNGTERETRRYFDSTGSQLYDDVRLLKGPGFAGGFESMVTDPEAHSRALCKTTR